MPTLGDDLRCVTLGDPARGTTSVFVPHGDPGAGTPVFFVPALGLDGRSFAGLAPLAAERRIVFWNPPNELPKSPGLDAFAATTRTHADRAGMPRRFVLAGSSLGAVIALATVLAAPDRIAGLILFGGTARWKDLGPPMRLARLLHPFLPRRNFHRTMPLVLAPGQADGNDILIALRLQMAHRTKDYADAVVEALTGAGKFDLTSRLAEIRAPTLLVHSLRDVIAPERALRTLAAIPNAQVVALEGSSHLPYLHDPDGTVGHLREFLARVDGMETR